MSYDSKSLDLAEHFLQDEPRTSGDAQELAQTIQTAVEDWFASRMPRCKQCDGSGVVNYTTHADAKCDLCGGSGWTEKKIKASEAHQ